MSETKKCLTCKPAGDLSSEEVPEWSKKWGNYSPYPKMITCDERYSLEDRDSLVEEFPEITDKKIELNMKFEDEYADKWLFYFASNPSEDPLKILSSEKAYGEDENHGLVKTDKNEMLNLY